MHYKRLFVENSFIFLTIVTYKRKNILIDNINILRSSFETCKKVYKFIIYAAVVNPNHIHLIIKPNNIHDYPKIVAYIKRYFTKRVNLNYTVNSQSESNIWQRRYWEHTIRDEADLNKHLDYIHYNPIKHGYVKAAKDWKYSSFTRFVKNGYYDEDWCNLKDINGILNMDLE